MQHRPASFRLAIAMTLALASAACGAAITIDLSYVDQQSTQFQRFRDWVDRAVDGDPDYGFSATDAAYMYRITGDDIYREWGWQMFKSFVKYTAVVEKEESELPDGEATVKRIKGFTSLSNADTIPPTTRDNMESFWMAETLKYFYLLFSDRDFISLEDHVFNTEAHPLPRFKPTGDLKTGWQRKPTLADVGAAE